MAEDLSVPGSLVDLTPEWMTEALRRSGALPEGRVVAVESEIMGQDIGFSSTLARLSLTYEGTGGAGPASLIAKFPSFDSKMRAWVQLYQGYEREVRFFSELAGRCSQRTGRCFYAGMEQRSGELIRTRDRRIAQSMPGWLQGVLVPLARLYARLRRRRYLLLLEDLSSKRLGDQIEGADFDDAQRVARALGGLHAEFWNADVLSTSGWLPARVGKLPGVRSSYRRNRDSFYRSAAVTPPPRFIDLMAWADDNLAAILANLEDVPVTLLHGDCGLENIFFDDTHVWLIDWQSASIGPGILDWAYFVIGNLRQEVGEDDELALLEIYHDQLPSKGASGYGLGDCRRHYRLAKLFLALTMVGWPDWNGPRTARLGALMLQRHQRLFARLPDSDWSDCLS